MRVIVSILTTALALSLVASGCDNEAAPGADVQTVSLEVLTTDAAPLVIHITGEGDVGSMATDVVNSYFGLSVEKLAVPEADLPDMDAADDLVAAVALFEGNMRMQGWTVSTSDDFVATVFRGVIAERFGAAVDGPQAAEICVECARDFAESCLMTECTQ